MVTKAAEVIDIRGKLSVNAVDEHDTLLKTSNLSKDSADEPSGMSERTVQAPGDFQSKLEEVVAIMNNRGPPRKGRPFQLPQSQSIRETNREAVRDPSKIRCTMRGQLGHVSLQCPKGFVEISKRPCFF